MVDFKKEVRIFEELRYWDKKRGKHTLKNRICRVQWKRLCERLGVEDYESEWDDSLTYEENKKRLVDKLDTDYLRY